MFAEITLKTRKLNNIIGSPLQLGNNSFLICPHELFPEVKPCPSKLESLICAVTGLLQDQKIYNCKKPGLLHNKRVTPRISFVEKLHLVS